MLITADASALWVTSWQAFSDHAWPGAWVNSLFRREGGPLASDLIREAVAITRSEFGDVPAHGLITFVDAAKVRRKRDPGRCYLRAGFSLIDETAGGHGRNPLLVFQMLEPTMPAPLLAPRAQGTFSFECGGAP